MWHRACLTVTGAQNPLGMPLLRPLFLLLLPSLPPLLLLALPRPHVHIGWCQQEAFVTAASSMLKLRVLERDMERARMRLEDFRGLR